MLPSQNRLTEEKDIMFSLRSRFSQTDKFFKLVLSRSKIKEPRICVIVGKKIFKKANKRHRVKRKTLAVLKKLLDSKQFKLYYFNCVIQCLNKASLHQNFENLESEITDLMQSAVDKAKNLKSTPKTKIHKVSNIPSRISSSVEQ